MAKVINENEAKEILYSHRLEEHTIFSLIFIKRTTSERREMICRFNVKSYLKGGVQPFNPKDYNLITVFEMSLDEKTGKPKGYKCIPFDGILEMKIAGQEYLIQK